MAAITQQFDVHGMHCASCAAKIEKRLSAQPGVERVAVNVAADVASVTYDPSRITVADMNTALKDFGYTITAPEQAMPQQPDAHAKPHAPEESHAMHHGQSSAQSGAMNHMQHNAPLEGIKRKLWLAFPVGAVLFVMVVAEIIASAFDIQLILHLRWFQFIELVVATPILFWSGQQFLQGIWRFVRHGNADMDSLIGIGTLVAYMYSAVIFIFPELRESIGLPNEVYFDVTIIVISFVLLGKYLEQVSKKKTGEAIRALLALQPNIAHVKRNGQLVDIPLEEVKTGDLCVIKAGEKIPVDGVIVEGETHIDESMITGESLPVGKSAKDKDKVIGATMNKEGVITIKATAVGKGTVLAQIVAMVQAAQVSKAPIQKLADLISAYFVPIVMVLAVVTFGIWFLVGSQYMSTAVVFPLALRSLIGILVIACPCALGLATPTAVMVGTGTAARSGILIKNAEALERAHAIDTIIFDKTGTLTQGKPAVTDAVPVQGSDLTPTELLRFAASLENVSEHPLGVAIVNRAAQDKLSMQEVQNAQVIAGQGIKGTLANERWMIGTRTLMEDHQVMRCAELDAATQAMEAEGKTVVYVAREKREVGVLALADTIKPESVQAIAKLKERGIHLIMMTGDNKTTAAAIAKQAGIEDVYAQVRPEDKAERIKQKQAEGAQVAMVGDGINDAPALAQADIGIAMSTGTDVAIESADMTLLHGDIAKVSYALRLSARTLRVIKQNLFWAFIYNVVGIPLAAGVLYPVFGTLLNPAFAGMAMAFSSLSVIMNSLRLRKLH